MTYPKLIVDAHTHMFNARHVPLKGVMESKGVPGFLAEITSTLLNLLTGKADFISSPDKPFDTIVMETDDIDELGDALAKIASAEMATRSFAKSLFTFDKGTFEESTSTLSALRTDELYSVLEKLEGLSLSAESIDLHDRQLSGVQKIVEELAGTAELKELNQHLKIQDWLFDRFHKSLSWLLKQLADVITADPYGSVLDYIKFLLLMLSKEVTLRESVLESYQPDQNVNLVLHLMMDMQKAYSDEEPYYPLYKKPDQTDGRSGRK